LNHLGKKREPFLFVIDFSLQKYYLSPLNEVDDDISFSLAEPRKNLYHNKKIPYHYTPISKGRYQEAFFTIQEEIKKGNTYLINLTFPSKLEIDYSLKEIYSYSDAKFKLLFKDKFVCFSPERFIKIENNTIYTHPMKGTIDATIPNAKAKILANEKEMAEHTMVVDLLRNDLSMVAKRVRVEKFRYIESIKAGERELLQVSSKIKGELEEHWQETIGDILLNLLPAGSISGTPKKSTIEIIKRVEGYDRGFYSGVFGLFDGESLDSAVMIRYIEKIGDRLYYKSGGGITIDSDVDAEYREMCEKIYVPFL
jgi:para-aminobenzoate synthetase component 1